MTAETQAMLNRWLTEGDELQRQHARHRLAQNDPVDPVEAYPSVKTVAWNAVKAAGRFVASSGTMVSTKEQEVRLAICRECDHFDATRVRCRKCGCFTNLKTRIASQHCPIKKW